LSSLYPFIKKNQRPPFCQHLQSLYKHSKIQSLLQTHLQNQASKQDLRIMGIRSCFFVLTLLAILAASAEAQLQMNFYSKSCPKAEQIVLDYVNKHIHNAPSLAAPLLRMHFHDCFVRGCDASVMLNATSNNTTPEKSAVPNLTLRGFGFIEGIKRLLEKECPGVVSCADVLALAARDSVATTGGPTWRVPTGRRDGRISNASEALNAIPPPTSNITTLQTLFGNVGLNLKDLTLLSGNFNSFSARLYNFTGRGNGQDPALDSEYATKLKRKCVNTSDNVTIVEMDPGSFRTFDRSYFKLLQKRRGLFQSDAALTTSGTTKSFINQFASGSIQNFFKEFALSMEKMGRINVKTGSAGEIRKTCALVN
ncbi:Peroxidase 3, partial [Linum perenne]